MPPPPDMHEHEEYVVREELSQNNLIQDKGKGATTWIGKMCSNWSKSELNACSGVQCPLSARDVDASSIRNGIKMLNKRKLCVCVWGQKLYLMRCTLHFHVHLLSAGIRARKNCRSCANNERMNGRNTIKTDDNSLRFSYFTLRGFSSFALNSHFDDSLQSRPVAIAAPFLPPSPSRPLFIANVSDWCEWVHAANSVFRKFLFSNFIYSSLSLYLSQWGDNLK